MTREALAEGLDVSRQADGLSRAFQTRSSKINPGRESPGRGPL